MLTPVTTEKNIVDRILDAAIAAGAERVTIDADALPGMKVPGQAPSVIPGFDDIVPAEEMVPVMEQIIKKHSRPGLGSHQFPYSRPGGMFRTYSSGGGRTAYFLFVPHR